MTLAFRRTHGRHCSRCGKELEDPASEERGVGPICAAKDTVLYARSIPANYAGATAIILGIHSEALPESVRERFAAVQEKILAKAERASNRHDDASDLHIQGEDLRKIIREIDWILSHRMDATIRNYFIKIVRFLGYVELAGVLSMEASTTPAKLWFNAEDGRIYLQGKSCRAGFNAMKVIKGSFIPKRGSEEPYSAPAAGANAFLAAVQEFWPLYDGDLEAIRKEAEQWHLTEAAKRALEAAKTASFTAQAMMRNRYLNGFDQGHWVEFSFPWIPGKKEEMYAVVNAIKNTIPPKERKYNPETKSWMVRVKHKPSVLTILGQWFKVVEEGD